ADELRLGEHEGHRVGAERVPDTENRTTNRVERGRLSTVERVLEKSCRRVELDPEHVRLRAEMVEERRPAHPRAPGDVVHRGALVALLDEQVERGILKRLARHRGRAATWRRISCHNGTSRIYWTQSSIPAHR